MRRGGRPSDGFGFAELLVGLSIGLVAVAAIVVELRASMRAVQTQGETVDLVQRVRAVAESVAGAIADAGSGFTRASPSGWVSVAAPRVVPARFAVRTTDPTHAAFDDRITVLSAQQAPGASTLAMPMGTPDGLLSIAPLPGCRPASPTCDLGVGDLALVGDRHGHTDLVEITAVSGNLLAHEPALLSHAYDPADRVRVIPLEARAFVFDAAAAQVREYRGRSQALVMADDVVGFHVRYFGTPEPPSGREFVPGHDTCVNTADGRPRLSVLAPDAGRLVELTPDLLADGPYCGAGLFGFDADLLRVRLVRLTLRVQASDPAVRGRSPALFARPGWAADRGLEVPDREVTLDVALRNSLTVG